MDRSISVALMCLTLVSCSPGERERLLPQVLDDGEVVTAVVPDLPSLLAEDWKWSLEVVESIETVPSGGDEPLVYNPLAISPLSNGNLLVQERGGDPRFVILDDADDRVVARFGSTGQGPGELGGWLQANEIDEEIVVLDSSNGQIHRFTLNGAHLRSTRIESENRVGKATVGFDGTSFLVEGFRSTESSWHRVLEAVSANGQVTSVLRLPDPPSHAEQGVIQQGRVIWTTLRRHVVAMWTSRPMVSVYSVTGEHESDVVLPLSQRHLTEEDIRAEVERVGGLAARLRPGPTSLTNELYPVNDTIFGVLVSNLRRAAEDPELPPDEIWWRLFTVNGEYLGVLPLPGGWQSFSVLASGDGFVWGSVLNEVGIPILQRMSLVRADGLRIPSS